MRASFDRAAIPYWDARATAWKIVPPLSPSDDDVRFYAARAALNVPANGRPMRALLLGVTRSIALMPWSAGTRLLALDWASNMIRSVWPGESVPPQFHAVRGDWREIPLASGALDFVVGDGCYSTFADLEGPAAMNREVHRALRPGGEFCLRCFRRPAKPVPIGQLFAWLFSGRYSNLDLFRWMLAMAVHGDSREGVSVHSVWRIWHEHVPDPEEHRARLGWTPEAVANMENWGRLETRYVFPTLAELEALAAPHFDLVACDLPRYEWGEQFPRLAMRRRAG